MAAPTVLGRETSLVRRRLIAFGAGALSALALAPFHAWPVLFMTLPVLVWLIDGAVTPPSPDAPKPAAEAGMRTGLARDRWRQFRTQAQWGWWWGFGYFMFGLFWIGEAFLVEPEIFGWLLPFAVTLMPAGLALFYAAATGLAGLFWMRGWRRALVLAIAIAILEWLRATVLTGFPWNTIGYALTYPVSLMQTAAMLGIFGLTLATVVLMTVPAITWRDQRARVDAHPASQWSGTAVALLAIATAHAWGSARLAKADLDAGTPSINVRIVQPSTPQREKWRPENQRRIFEDLLTLSRTDARARGGLALADAHLVVWPEAAMPFLPLEYPEALQAIAAILPPKTHLAAGALRIDSTAAGAAPGARPQIYNSLLFFTAERQPSAIYDKIHLVPFGEYLPLQHLLEAVGLQQLTKLRGGFAAGPSPRPLIELDGLPVMEPLICYEVIFPGEIGKTGRRAKLLLNVTNDGWFGNTTGPRQHLHMARVRSVEQGLPLVRAANNGISAVVDAYGRLQGQLDLNVRDVIDVRLPQAIAAPLYARLGDGIFLLLSLAFLVLSCVQKRS